MPCNESNYDCICYIYTSQVAKPQSVGSVQWIIFIISECTTALVFVRCKWKERLLRCLTVGITSNLCARHQLYPLNAFPSLYSSHNVEPLSPAAVHTASLLAFTVCMTSFVSLIPSLQGGHFDLPDRLFHSIPDSWKSASQSNMADIKELIPEFFYMPEFLTNNNHFELGTLYACLVSCVFSVPSIWQSCGVIKVCKCMYSHTFMYTCMCVYTYTCW